MIFFRPKMIYSYTKDFFRQKSDMSKNGHNL